MKILVVNAHSNSIDGQRAFKKFLEYLKEALKTYIDMLDIEHGCIVRTKDDLDDFLYGECGAYNSKTSARHFDSLDLVFISGSTSLIPWGPSTLKMNVLIRMCLQVKKRLFACGTAMESLVYLSASNLEKAIRVINGNGKGSKLGDIGNLNIPLETLKAELDCFLDGATGDLYTFKHHAREWVPMCNIGLHHARMAQEYNTLGKYVIQAPVYRPKKEIQNRVQSNFFYENYEVVCYPKKRHSNHWLFAQCGLEFTVPDKSKWQVHSFAFMNKDKTFEVLAESEKGPVIIEYTNIIGVKFEIDRKYPETVQILYNFLAKYTKEIIGTHKSHFNSIITDMPVSYNKEKQYVYHSQSSRETDMNMSTNQNTDGPHPSKSRISRGNSFYIRHMKHNSVDSKSKGVDEIRHSGFAMKKVGQQIQQHNFISAGKLPLNVQQGVIKSFLKYKRNDSASIDYNNASIVNGDFSITDRPIKSILNSPRNNQYGNGVDPNENLASRRGSSNRKVSIRETENEEDEVEQRSDMYKDLIDYESTLTKETVRKILYPELPQLKLAFEKRCWVPGSMSSRIREESGEGKSIKVIPPETERPYKPKSSRIATSRNSKDTSVYKTLRASCPYKTFYDVKKDHQKKEDEKIIGSKAFIVSSKTSFRNLVQSQNRNYERLRSSQNYFEGYLKNQFYKT